MHKIKAIVCFYPPESGGRHCMPVATGYAPYLRVPGEEELYAVRINGMPSDGEYTDECAVEIELTYHPRIDYSSLLEANRFEIIEGSKVVGEGRAILHCDEEN